ncbi:MAG: hypothetical protein LAO20_00340 [Acidobacteriia bacterium]|nr:hypothetical protein [Terriglobia bacterium]
MAIIGETQALERIQFFNGQRLMASDLQGLEALNREMRWLHNQSLHQPGVGSGFAVSGLRGDRQVTITAGYALDALGREIVLTQTFVLQVPPVADNGFGAPVVYDLAVSYPDDTQLKAVETRDGICNVPPGVVRLREGPIFCWVELGDDDQPIDARLKLSIQSGLFIVLARAEVFNCKLNQDISIVQRRSARMPKQPRIACGSVVPPSWTVTPLVSGQSLPFEVDSSSFVFLPFKFSAVIDTTSGSFSGTPTYTARMLGNMVITDSSGGTLFLSTILDIDQQKPKSFLLEVVPAAQIFVSGGEIPQPFTVPANIFEGWKVTWMGVEG